MTVRCLLAFGHAATRSDLAVSLTAAFHALPSGPDQSYANVVVDVSHVSDCFQSPAALFGIYKPDIFLILPPTGSFSRSAAAPGRPAPIRDAVRPTGHTALDASLLPTVVQENNVAEAAVMMFEAAARAGIHTALLFPERLGGFYTTLTASLWDHRAFARLVAEGLATTAAAYSCDLIGEGPQKPVRVMATSPAFFDDDCHDGAPILTRVGNDVTYRGPLPNTCNCGQVSHSGIGRRAPEGWRPPARLTHWLAHRFVASLPLRDRAMTSVSDTMLPQPAPPHPQAQAPSSGPRGAPSSLPPSASTLP